MRLEANSGKPPLVVNAGAGKAANLNADMVDGKHASAFLPKGGKAADADKLDGKDFSDLNAAHQVLRTTGPLPKEATFTSKGGTLVVTASGSGFRSSANTLREGEHRRGGRSL